MATYKKTQTGITELNSHQLGLRTELRRLLILIDGKRSIQSLAPFFRPGEVSGLVDELERLGAIEMATPITGMLPSATASSAISSKQLQAAIGIAKTVAKSRFNRAADRFITELDRCKDSQSLRAIVSDIQLKLMAEYDEEMATAFVAQVRAEFNPKQ